MDEATFVVVGGGIAGVTCAETLAFLEPEQSIILISDSPLIKAATDLVMLTKTLCHFNVEERDLNTLSVAHKSVTVFHDSFVEISSEQHILHTRTKTVKYKYLCLCVGGEPKIIPQAKECSLVLGIRDTDSVETFITKLGRARKILIVGNGGIASELVYKVRNVDIHWAVKDKHISATFVDPGAAEFFKPSLNKSYTPETPMYSTRMRYQQNESGSGAALGPDWYNNLDISGANVFPASVKIHYESEVAHIKVTNGIHPVQVTLTNGDVVDCDLVVSAIGVHPRTNYIVDKDLDLATDGGIKVNSKMETSVNDVFAAGDVCTPTWEYAKHWFLMRLWSQARQMGAYAAKCMAAKLNGEDVLQDFCFEMFAHSTRLFGYDVVLLGLYNGQKLGNDYECLVRMTPKVEYIKFVIQNGRLQGAVLIGNRDLAETCENLILNQLDISPYGDDILDPNIDIEDYFD